MKKITSILMAVCILSLNVYSITEDQIPEYIDANERLVGNYVDILLNDYEPGARLDENACTVVLTVAAFVLIRATPTLCRPGYSAQQMSHLESILQAGNNQTLARAELAKLTL